MKKVKSKEEFLKLDDEGKRIVLEYHSLSWFDRDDFEELNDCSKRYALIYQSFSWFDRDDFAKLDDYNKRIALKYQPLTWFNREDFAKLDDDSKWFALQHQSLSWFDREDFEELNDYNKWIALIYQSLSWFDRDDFKKLRNDYKWYALQYQFFSWFDREDYAKLDDDNKTAAVNQFPKTEKNKRKEAEAYASKHNLKIDQNYLYAFRDHDKRGAGIFRVNNCYETGRYNKDWHCDIRPNIKNSFGYGIWPSGNTKVKVKIEDWGVEVADDGNGKARVWGFEVIEGDFYE